MDMHIYIYIYIYIHIHDLYLYIHTDDGNMAGPSIGNILGIYYTYRNIIYMYIYIYIYILKNKECYMCILYQNHVVYVVCYFKARRFCVRLPPAGENPENWCLLCDYVVFRILRVKTGPGVSPRDAPWRVSMDEPSHCVFLWAQSQVVTFQPCGIACSADVWHTGVFVVTKSGIFRPTSCLV